MKLELTIPTSLSEIPLVNYQKFIEVSQNNEDSDFISQKMIEIFCGIRLNEVVKMKMTDVVELNNHFIKLFESNPKLKPTFFIGEQEFGFIPDIENISLGEYVDLNKYINDIKTLHKAMAVMYRPITKKKGHRYEIMPYEGTKEFADVMKFAPLEVVLPARVFFWTLGLELVETISQSLDTLKMTKKQREQVEILFKNGDGIRQFTTSLKEMLQNSMKLPSKVYSQS